MKNSHFKMIVKRLLKKDKEYSNFEIKEIAPLQYKKSDNNKLRINLLTTSINSKDVYAGIKTAFDFFYNLGIFCNADMRILVMDKPIDKNDVYAVDKFVVCSAEEEYSRSIIDCTNRKVNVPVSSRDIFIATMWHTLYSIYDLLDWSFFTFEKQNTVIYLIQDFEPGFYPWSSRYLLAESTYKSKYKIIAVYNSFYLRDYFDNRGYSFYKSFAFEPRLNSTLKRILLESEFSNNRRNQILIYGRPTKNRNAFELLLMSLDLWYRTYPNSKEWAIVSAGQEFPDIVCPSGLIVKSLGKLSLEEYANVMLSSKIGISLMVSPHPSYPPLEMAAFGLKVITNQFETKDLSSFSENIISIDSISTINLAETLSKLASETTMPKNMINSKYMEDDDIQWSEIYNEIRDIVVY